MFLFVTSAFFLSPDVCAEQKPIRVGVLSGLTGAAAKWNRFQNMGMELAQEELRSKGTEIELIFEDSKTASAHVISAFEKLMTHDSVDAVIADDFGFVLGPLVPKIHQRDKLFIAVSVPHDRFCSSTSDAFYSISSQFSLTTSAFERFFELHPEVKRIAAVVFDDPEWGNTYLRIWKDIAARRGVEIVETFLSAELTPDPKTYWTRIVGKKPDAIFLAHEPEGFFKGKDQFGFSGYVVAANNVLEMLADSSAPRPELEGVYVVDPAISDEFRARFVGRFKREPILEAYSGYESVKALSRAFSASRSDPAAGMKSVRYGGVAGEIDFTGETCVGNRARWALYRFQAGRMVKQ